MHSRTRQRVLAAVVAVFGLGLVGCGAAEGTTAGEGEPGTSTTEEHELSTAADTFVALRPDYRRCAAPHCGGWFVRDLNVGGSEFYVYRLSFYYSNLDTATVAKVTSAPPGEVVLKGRLSQYTYQGYRAFQVLEAFRGLPGVGSNPSVAPVSGAFWQVELNGTMCITTPCPSWDATKVNTTTTEMISGVLTSGIAASLLDHDWLRSRILTRHAVVAGVVVPDSSGGWTNQLKAEQVFIRLPDEVGPCPMFDEPMCPGGTVNVYTRTEDRCIVPLPKQQNCVSPGVCPMYFPNCDAGYDLVSWRAAPDGCEAYVCEPSWL